MVAYDRRNESEDWPSYQRLVLDKLDVLEQSVKDLGVEVTTLRVEMATQKTKMTLFGSAAGLLAATAAELVWHLLGGVK